MLIRPSYTFVIVLMGMCLNTIRGFSNCPGNICQQTFPPNLREGTSVFVGFFEGCQCREFPFIEIFCFGRNACRQVPKLSNITAKSFELRATQITEIHNEDFDSFGNVENLSIVENANLTKIFPKTFKKLTKLRDLSISYNSNLNYLHQHTFDGLVSLERLKLLKNGFVDLSKITPALNKLPKLFKLELSENSFINISSKDFLPLKNTSLQELNLILCQIEYIEPKAFNSLKNLRSLRLGENNFESNNIAEVIKEISKNTSLQLLNLYSVGLRKSSSKNLMTAIGESNITTLILARNQFEVITPDTFASMPNIETLDLREVLALNITKDAFIGLPNLKTLLLSGNKLTSIPEGVLLKKLVYLDLQKNSGSSYSSSSFSLFGQKFKKMTNLTTLDLGFNAIHALYNNSFDGLDNLRVLGLKNATIFVIANYTFAKLKKLTILNLDNNYFVKNHVLVPEIFQGLENLKVLLLGSCNINYIDQKVNPFKYLINLEHLGLSGNQLISLNGLDVLPKLHSLDVTQNSLQPWYEPLLSKNFFLKSLEISDNKLTFLTNAMMQDFSNLTQLELRNPFTCDCSFNWNNHKILHLIRKQVIYCAYPDSVTNLTITQYLKLEHPCHNITLMVVLTVLVIFFFGVLFFVFYFRWHLRYWLFLTRLYLSRNRKIKTSSKVQGFGNYTYDAFVSYSNEDRNFVIRLVAMLENYPPYIKLCVYERDFEIGAMISENVLENVSRSRKTLLIISNSYAKSQWCRWESQIAEHHRIFFQNEKGEYVDDSLILIKLGPVHEAHLTPTLKYLLKTRIYLKWDIEESKQKVFWDKLRKVLAPPVEINENTYL